MMHTLIVKWNSSFLSFYSIDSVYVQASFSPISGKSSFKIADQAVHIILHYQNLSNLSISYSWLLCFLIDMSLDIRFVVGRRKGVYSFLYLRSAALNCAHQYSKNLLKQVHSNMVWLCPMPFHLFHIIDFSTFTKMLCYLLPFLSISAILT